MSEMGHNKPPLDLRAILEAHDISVEEVLHEIVKIWIEDQKDLPELAKGAEAIASNSKRLPDAFDASNIDKAFSLYNAMLTHLGKVKIIEESLPENLKQASKTATAAIKPAGAGLADLQEALRQRIAAYLHADLLTQSAEAVAAGKNIYISTIGLRGTITIGKIGTVENIEEVPAAYLTVDAKKVATDIKAGKTIPGIKVAETPALRITSASDTD